MSRSSSAVGGQQGTARDAERQVAQLVEDDEVAGDSRVAICPALPWALLFKRVDELDGGEEEHPLVVMLDSLNPKRRGDVGFPVPGPPTRRMI